MTNPCNVCLHRWTPDKQAESKGHCYMWREEPQPCPRSDFRLDEWEFQRDIARQLLGRNTEPQSTVAGGGE
jgi:hypothetical protein